MFLLTFVCLVLDAFLAFQFHAVQTIVELSFLRVESAEGSIIEWADWRLLMGPLLGTSMQLFIAFAAVDFLVLGAVIDCFDNLAILAKDIGLVPLANGPHALPDEINLVLQTTLRFFPHPIPMRVDVQLLLALRYVDGVDADWELTDVGQLGGAGLVDRHQLVNC